MKKKYDALQITRHIIQAASFLLFPGLFVSVYSAFKQIYISVVNGGFSMSSDGGALMLLAAVVIVTALAGRFFCGFLCSFGALGELVWYISGKFIKNRRQPPREADRVLKKLKYIVLVLLFVLVWNLGLVIDSSLNPLYAFGVLSRPSDIKALSVLTSVGGLLLIGIIIGSAFIERFFCRYLCPVGAILSVVSKPRLFKISRNGRSCVSCGRCDMSCAMGIDVSGGEKVMSGECVNCMKCAASCPMNSLSTNANQLVAGTAAVAVISGMYYAGNIAQTNTAAVVQQSAEESALYSDSSAVIAGKYADGQYEGSAQGYRGTVSVSVTVENGYITSIDVLSYRDDAEFFNKAYRTVSAEIIASQDTDVDTVSGATFSSRGLINAVKNALYSLTGESDGNDQSTVETAPEMAEDTAPNDGHNDHTEESAPVIIDDTPQQPSDNNGNNNTGSTVLADGVYSGTGTGYRGAINVEVTVSGGRVTDITVLSYRDDDRFFNAASGTVINEIISAQSLDVATVSGATFSSNGIIEAVADALGISYEKPANNNNNSEQHNGGHSHGHRG